MTGRALRAAVLGHPIRHSLSPVLHRAAYRELGLDWRYDAVDVTEAGLESFLQSLDDAWVGLSLTMPLKRAVLPLLEDSSQLVRVIGSANTVVLAGGRRVGHNTDVPGIVAALREAGIREPGCVGIVGAGATATAAIAAAREMGLARVAITARRPEALDEVAALGRSLALSVEAVPWARREEVLAADVVVVTLPGDVAAPLAAFVPAEPGVLMDVSYHPWPTRLASAWRDAGGLIVPGHRMLLHQAGDQVKLMTGFDAPLAAMDAALARALGS